MFIVKYPQEKNVHRVKGIYADDLKLMLEFLKGMDYLPSECSGCEAMGYCDGGCREAAHIWAGRPDAPDPLLSNWPAESEHCRHKDCC